jgi:hypothetical protein
LNNFEKKYRAARKPAQPRSADCCDSPHYALHAGGGRSQ